MIFYIIKLFKTFNMYVFNSFVNVFVFLNDLFVLRNSKYQLFHRIIVLIYSQLQQPPIKNRFPNKIYIQILFFQLVFIFNFFFTNILFASLILFFYLFESSEPFLHYRQNFVRYQSRNLLWRLSFHYIYIYQIYQSIINTKPLCFTRSINQHICNFFKFSVQFKYIMNQHNWFDFQLGSFIEDIFFQYINYIYYSVFFEDIYIYIIFLLSIYIIMNNLNEVVVNVPEGYSAPLFVWNSQKTSTKLLLDNQSLTCTVKEGSGFKTTMGTETFVAGGRYYFQIFINKGQLIKVGVSRPDINLQQAFSDTLKGWGIYNGELRHNSNSTGPKYGTQLQTNDIIGVALDMVEGTLSFYRNGDYWGVAYKDEQLKNGELYAACAPIYVNDQFTLRSMVKQD